MRHAGALLVLVLFLGAGLPASAEASDPGGSFFDDDGIVHEGAIEAIRTEQVTRGCNPPQNTNYCPDDRVTRGQMAAFLTRALGLDVFGPASFVDTSDSVYASDIAALATAGITRGCNPPANTRFCPDDRVTRGQMAAFLVRAFGYTDQGHSDLFTDDDSSVFESDIDRLAAAGVTRGCNPPTNSRFCPEEAVTRGEMATFLARALHLTLTDPPMRTDTAMGTQLNLLELAEAQGCPFALDQAPDDELETCSATVELPTGEPFWVQHGWFTEDPALFESLRDSEFQLSLNSTPLDLFQDFSLEGSIAHWNFRFQFPANMPSATHRLEGTWLFEGIADRRVVLDVRITP